MPDSDNTSANEKNEKLQEEKALVQKRLNDALKLFYDNQTQEAAFGFFDELVYACIYNLTVAVPIDIRESKMQYGTFHLGQGKYAYIACTSTDDLVKCPQLSSAWLPWKKLLIQAARDNGFEGIIIDPYHETEGKILINRAIITRILEMAHDSMRALPDDIRDAVMNGI